MADAFLACARQLLDAAPPSADVAARADALEQLRLRLPPLTPSASRAHLLGGNAECGGQGGGSGGGSVGGSHRSSAGSDPSTPLHSGSSAATFSSAVPQLQLQQSRLESAAAADAAAPMTPEQEQQAYYFYLQAQQALQYQQWQMQQQWQQLQLWQQAQAQALASQAQDARQGLDALAAAAAIAAAAAVTSSGPAALAASAAATAAVSSAAAKTRGDEVSSSSKIADPALIIKGFSTVELSLIKGMHADATSALTCGEADPQAPVGAATTAVIEAPLGSSSPGVPAAASIQTQEEALAQLQVQAPHFLPSTASWPQNVAARQVREAAAAAAATAVVVARCAAEAAAAKATAGSRPPHLHSHNAPLPQPLPQPLHAPQLPLPPLQFGARYKGAVLSIVNNVEKPHGFLSVTRRSEPALFDHVQQCAPETMRKLEGVEVATIVFQLGDALAMPLGKAQQQSSQWRKDAAVEFGAEFSPRFRRFVAHKVVLVPGPAPRAAAQATTQPLAAAKPAQPPSPPPSPLQPVARPSAGAPMPLLARV